jgi:large subunit ribosomal protein L10
VNKEEKQQAVKEIGAELETSSAVFAVDYRGISVPQAAELRDKLGEADATFSIVKNRLAKRITAESGAEALDEHLVGPTALTYVRGDAVIAAKAIAEFTKEHQILAYKGGIMEGEPLDPEQFTQIARLPGVEQLRGQLVGLAASPLTGLVQSLNGLIAGLATQLGQIAEQGLVGGEAPPAEEAGEAPGEEAEAEEPQAEAEEPQAEAEEPQAEAEEPQAEAEEPQAEAEEPQAEAEEPQAEAEEPQAEAEAAQETSEQAEQDDTDAGDDPADEEETKED